MLGCLILGGSFFYLDINIRKVPNISFLKEEIKKKKENDFSSIDPDNLKLWKVEISAGDKRLKQLMSNAEIDIDSIAKDLGAELLDPMLKITRYFPATYNLEDEHVHIIVQLPPLATTGKGKRPLVSSFERDFWIDLPKAQIVLKLTDGTDKLKSAEFLSNYVKVEGDEIVLNDDIMFNAKNDLVLNNGEPVLFFSEPINFVKFLRFRHLPNRVVYGVTTQDILIKDSYLQMIEKIEVEHNSAQTKGCAIIGTPGIGKTHFSIYLAFYLARRYPSNNIVYEQAYQDNSKVFYIEPNKCITKIDLKLEDSSLPEDIFYIVESVTPAPLVTKFTYLITTPKNKRWHDFNKKEKIMTYYAPIWSEEEIWNVWYYNKKYSTQIPENRVKELITRWGCIPRRVFVDYEKEPKISEILPHCNVHAFLKNEDLGDEYSGKIIHIIPSSDFKERTYVAASDEIFMALYNYYENNVKKRLLK